MASANAHYRTFAAKRLAAVLARYAAGQIVLAGSASAGSDVLTVALEVHNDADLTTLFRHNRLNYGSYPMAVVPNLNAVRFGSEQVCKALG